MERSLSLHVNYWFILAKENFITVIFSTPLLRMITYRLSRVVYNRTLVAQRCEELPPLERSNITIRLF